jgi:peptidoglycan hydrolase-like protein with peptidoglycan-binding domain
MRRRTVLTAAVLAVAGTAGAGWWLREPPAAPVTTGVPTGTATVTRTDLANTAQIPGTLGYTGAYTAYWQGGGGTVTWLPTPGQVITRGNRVFAVDNRPVRLFYADRPMWRPLAVGITAGPDVRAVEANLVALGHATSANLTVDGRFTAATAAALRRWQRATGQPVTGRLTFGAVSFQPGPLRVTALGAKAGGPAGGPLVSGTSPAVQVTLAVPTDRTRFVHRGASVTVTLPDGGTVPGRVTKLSTVASAPTEADRNRGEQLASVPATVTLNRRVDTAGLDQAPVQVGIVAESVKGVLAVPITALVALAEGGYGLYLVDGAARRLVGVKAGLFSDTLVQVEGAGLDEGTTVEVPAT